MTEQMSEFEAFVKQLPKAMEMALDDGGTGTSTAFYSARRAGWSFDEIVHDALSSVRRGGGPGVVVNRLKTLATHGRTKETERALRDGGYLPTPTPPAFEQEPHPVLSAEHFRQRVQLLYQIKGEAVGPDEAEFRMTELILAQRSSDEAPVESDAEVSGADGVGDVEVVAGGGVSVDSPL